MNFLHHVRMATKGAYRMYFRNASPFLELSDGDNSFVAIQHLAHSPLPGPRDIHGVGSQTTRGAPRAILTARSRI
jgi:hypothetical protein